MRYAAASAGKVRRRLVDDLVRRGFTGELVEDAALLVSELVANAIRARRTSAWACWKPASGPTSA